MNNDKNNLRMMLREALDNMWSRIRSLFGGLDDRVTALEQGGGGGGGGQMNVIEAISFNGANILPDSNKRVSMTETDPTVPLWAKQTNKPTYTAYDVGAIPRPSIPADITQSDNALPEGTVSRGTSINVYDTNNNVIAAVSAGVYKDGRTSIYITANNYVNGSLRSASFGIYLDKDNQTSFSVSSPSSLRTAIGAATLGETSDTAYRGDRGKAAYDHAQAKGSAFASGLYKIQTNAEGHVTGAVAVAKSDITDLGVPSQDTTYEPATQSDDGLMSSSDKRKLDVGYLVNNVANANSTENKTSHTINIPPSSLHFLLIESTGTSLHAYGMVASTASGVLVTQTMQKTNSITLTNGTGAITVDLGSTARPLHVVDIRLRGTGYCSIT